MENLLHNSYMQQIFTLSSVEMSKDILDNRRFLNNVWGKFYLASTKIKWKLYLYRIRNIGDIFWWHRLQGNLKELLKWANNYEIVQV